jgi:hypothetical protein
MTTQYHGTCDLPTDKPVLAAVVFDPDEGTILAVWAQGLPSSAIQLILDMLNETGQQAIAMDQVDREQAH